MPDPLPPPPDADAAPTGVDVVVVGGGGSGCLAARRLAAAGLRVVLVERGGPPPGASRSPAELREEPAARLLVRTDPAWPYRDGPSGGHRPYRWVRAVGLGGRLNYWLGTSLRFDPVDFADPRSPLPHWPITAGDLAPYYDELEDELGCEPHHPFPLDEADEWTIQAAAACGLAAAPARQASPWPGAGRARRSVSPLDRWLPEALATGRCTVLPSTVVRRVLTRHGRACGVEAVVAGSAEAVSIRAPVVVLAASTVETARLLLDSATSEHPDGLGQHGGQVGTRLMDHVVMWARALVRVPSAGWDPDRPAQTCYLPACDTGQPGAPPPSRFHVQVMVHEVTGTAPVPPGPGRVVAMALAGVGEGLAIPGNGVALDPSGKLDANGCRVPLVRFAWDEAHRRFARRMRTTLLALVDHLPGEVVAVDGDGLEDEPCPGGHGHEVGTAPMGADPATSVVSTRGEVHGVENLFVVDGSPFVSHPHKNPTLTILANAARVCDAVVGS